MWLVGHYLEEQMVIGFTVHLHPVPAPALVVAEVVSLVTRHISTILATTIILYSLKPRSIRRFVITEMAPTRAFS